MGEINRLTYDYAYYMPNLRVRNHRDSVFEKVKRERDLHKSLKLLLKKGKKGLTFLVDSGLRSSNSHEGSDPLFREVSLREKNILKAIGRVKLSALKGGACGARPGQTNYSTY